MQGKVSLRECEDFCVSELVVLAKFGSDDKLMNQSCCQELLLVLSLDSKFENARR